MSAAVPRVIATSAMPGSIAGARACVRTIPMPGSLRSCYRAASCPSLQYPRPDIGVVRLHRSHADAMPTAGRSVGVLKEGPNETRVALVPGTLSRLREAGLTTIVEAG